MSPDSRSSEATERTPLLRDEEQNESPVEDGGQDGAQQADDVPLAEEPSTKKLLAIMGAMWLGSFFAALGKSSIFHVEAFNLTVAIDTTIVATLTGAISSDFNSLSLLSWLATGYLIANAACQPLSGKLTDIFGRRAGLIFSNIFFGAGCLISGFAQSESAVIAGRVIAGMGGGGLNAISVFVSTDLVPLRRRGVWQGYGNIIFGLGMGLGGTVGGWLNDWVGWRWAFLIQVPFICVSGLLVFFLVKIPVKEHNKSAVKRIDFLGAALLVTSLVFLLLGLNSGGNQFPWTHPFILTVLPLSFVTFLAFIYVEDRVAAEPIIPVRLILRRTVLSACLTNWFGTMSVFLALYYVPLYLQVRGFSALDSGLRLIPYAASLSAGSLSAGFIMRKTGRYYILSCALMALLVTGSALYITFDLNTPTWATYVYMTPAGVGYGGMLTVTLIAMISAVEHKDQAVITSASYAFRSTGSTIGITIASAVFQNILTMELKSKYGDTKGGEKAIERIRNSLDEINHLPKGWHKVDVLDSYMHAIRGAFLAGLALAVTATTVSLFMREHTLHKNLARK
jgi:MFS family permease